MQKLLLLAFLLLASFSFAQQCAPDEYDMLDWFTLDPDLAAAYHLLGSTNPQYTVVYPDKFYHIKSAQGYPWDIMLVDDQYIYHWVTELNWADPTSYKKFTYDTNMPLTKRCSKTGFAAFIQVPDTSYTSYVNCTPIKTQKLKTANNRVMGPYAVTLGGDLPPNLTTLVVQYRYDCDTNYAYCMDKEEYTLAQRYGTVKWEHFKRVNGVYASDAVSIFNKLSSGSTQPVFTCF